MANKFLHMINFCVLGISINVFATETTQMEASVKNDIPRPIVAILTEDAPALSKPSEFCLLYSKEKLKAGQLVIVVAERECRSRSGGVVNHYEIAIGSKRFFVEKSKIILPEEQEELAKRLGNEARVEYFDKVDLMATAIKVDNLAQLHKTLDSHKKIGLTIANVNIYDVSEYTDGTGFSIKVVNPTIKKIKYIWISVVGINAVGDPVRDRVKGVTMQTVKAIGPIDENESASYSWDYLWHTDIVEDFKITQIKVQYTDNTLKIIKNWKSIILDDQELITLESDN